MDTSKAQGFWKDVGGFIFIEDDPRPVECLVVLGAPWIELIQHVANLYHQDISHKIFVCGKYSAKTGKVNLDKLPEEHRRDYRTESEMIKRILVEAYSVPEEDIVEESKSTNTHENALYGLRAIAPYGFKTIGICCQAFHARRAKMTFESLAPEHNFLVFPATTQGISKDNWTDSEYGIKRVLGELERCGKYFPLSI